MQRKEMAELLTLMQTAYQRFYQNMTSSELKRTLDVWSTFFAEDSEQIVSLAIKRLIECQEYPPTIADVKREIAKIADTVTEKPTAIEEWNAIRNAIRNSGYNSVEMFNALPSIAKKFVGSPAQLRVWGLSTDFNDGVLRGQFLKQYEILANREKYASFVTPEIKRILDETKMLEGRDTQ